MIKKGWKYIVVLLCLICLVGCGSSNIGTPGEQGNSSNQGEVDLSSYEYFADFMIYVQGIDYSPFHEVAFWDQEGLQSLITMLDEDTGECSAREFFGRNSSNIINNTIYGTWYTNGDTVLTFEFVEDELKSISYKVEVTEQQLGNYEEALDMINDSLQDSQSFYYDQEYMERENNRYAMMLRDCIVEVSKNESGECILTFYSNDGYQKKYAEDYVYFVEKCTSYEQLLYIHKRENQLLYTGSIPANQIQGGLMACTPEINGRYFYSDGNTLWEWDEENPTRILSDENIRYLNIWDGYLYYMSGPEGYGRGTQAECHIVRVPLTGGVSEVVVDNAVDWGTGYWIREDVLYYNTSTRTGASSKQYEMVTFDLSTMTETKREVDRAILAISYNAFYTYEPGGKFICSYTMENGREGQYVISDTVGSVIGNALPYTGREAAYRAPSLYSVDGYCYYYVTDMKKETCRIMCKYPGGEALEANVGEYGYDGAFAIHVGDKLYFNLGLYERSMIGVAKKMIGQGLVFAWNDTIYDTEIKGAYYIYQFQHSSELFYGTAGNIYCEGNGIRFPKGFTVITETNSGCLLPKLD